MKKVFFLSTVFALLVLPLGCNREKRKFNEAQKVVEAYFEAYEARNADSTYSYLCDKPYVLQSPDGSVAQFAARPDLETYKNFFSQVPEVSILTVTARPDLSNLNVNILVFEITGRSTLEGMKIISFLAFAGRNSAGDWTVLLPATSVSQQSVTSIQSATSIHPATSIPDSQE
ncbi:hypothetical protein JXM67_11235 [candidate division WOR-3 bacterium]|nr:hypothetical protein [candidate division WOR-3 bacterium]